MGFLNKLFGSRPAASTPVEGDIFYSMSGEKYSFFKLLKHDPATETFHVMIFETVDKLPGRTSDLKVMGHHSPIASNGFGNMYVFASGKVEDADLAGYYYYLSATGNWDELIPVIDRKYREACALSDEKKFREAITVYDQVIELAPAFFEAIDNRAFCYMDLAQWDMAIEGFKKSLVVKPDSALAEFSIGECYLKQRKFTEAIAQFKNALKIDPDHAHSLKFLKMAQDMERQSDNQ